MRRPLVLAIALALGIAGAVRAQDKDELNPLRPGIDLDLEDAPIGSAIAAIASRAHTTIFVEPHLVADNVTVSLRDIPWRDALDVVARMLKLTIVRLKGGTPYVLKVPRVTLDLTDVPVREAVARVSSAARGLAVVANDVEGRVSVSFADTDARMALRAIARACDADAEALDVHGVTVITRRRVAGISPIGTSVTISQLEAPAQTFAGIDVDLDDADLREIVERVSPRRGMNVVVEPDYVARVSLQARNIPWPDLIAYLAASTGGEIETFQKVAVLKQRPHVSLRACGVTIATWFKLLGLYSGKNVAIGSGGELRAAPLSLDTVRWSEALEISALANGFLPREEGQDTIALSPMKGPAMPAEVLAAPRPTVAAPPPARSPEEIDDLISDAFASLERDDSREKIRSVLKNVLDLGPAMIGIARTRLQLWSKRLRDLVKPISEELDVLEAEGLIVEAEDLTFKHGAPLDHARPLVERAIRLCAVNLSHPMELSVRLGVLGDRAKALKKCLARMEEAIGAAGGLGIEAIVIDPRPESKDRVVLNGRIYEVGDAILDPAGREVPGFRLVRIHETSLRFRYEDIEFSREVGP